MVFVEKTRYLTVVQANDYFGLAELGFSVNWWYTHWRKIKGCLKIGGSVLVDREMVDQYFKELANQSGETIRGTSTSGGTTDPRSVRSTKSKINDRNCRDSSHDRGHDRHGLVD
jgi:hypothetical protein